jgi:two-component system, OmpR family, sensor histidine kinase VicK
VGLSETEVIGMTQASLDAALRQRSLAPQAFVGLDACFAPAEAQGPRGQLQGQLLTFATPHTRVIRLLGLRTQGHSVSQVLYAVDVTQQHQLDTIKSEFLSTAAHELRTPMASIYGFTELMMKRAMKPEQQQDLLARIYRQSQLMIAILNELLDLARIESRRGQDFTLETLPLVLCVQSALTDFKVPEGREPPVTALPPDLSLKVRVDRQKFQQALLNILSNAYKYSPGGGAVEVSLVHGGAIPGAELGIVIADHGLGLRPDELARWGERFFRADKSGNIPGTGLGVSIVKELLELMGGHLAVASQHGQGTQVTLWLPRMEVAASAPA